VADEETMVVQLGHLLTFAAAKPNISLSSIPGSARRGRSPGEGFWLFDSAQVAVELTGDYLTIREPREIRLYEQAFTDHAAVAEHGAGVRNLIAAAIDAVS
jgi:Domain of unknown function (DUF5753)